MTGSGAGLHVVFRTDASIDIGTGHVMRCLTLATALADQGADCTFVCRLHEGHLLDLIKTRGFGAIALPKRSEDRSAKEDAPYHADWLGVHWSQDAEDTVAALASLDDPIDWLIVDHYALDAAWERALRPSCRKLMVIDDLADRAHDCDLLLDQSLGRTSADYVALLPEGTITLLGPRYALLRPEFAAMRAESLARRAKPALKSILVTMGGVDKGNATTHVLDALAASALSYDTTVTVVLGPHAPWLEHVRAHAKGMPFATEVRVGVANMAALMARSDLAIGAGGTTSWERCSLGLPSITLVLAQNQIDISCALEKVGATQTLKQEQNIEASICQRLAQEGLASMLASMSCAAAQVTDGLGTGVVVGYLMDTHD